MSAFTCPKCNILRAREPHELCPICWLVDELAREHEAGEHDSRLNEACVTCTRARTVVERAAADVYNSTVRVSHRDCTHPKTKSARTVCRERRRVDSGKPRYLVKKPDDAS